MFVVFCKLPRTMALNVWMSVIVVFIIISGIHLFILVSSFLPTMQLFCNNATFGYCHNVLSDTTITFPYSSLRRQQFDQEKFSAQDAV